MTSFGAGEPVDGEVIDPSEIDVVVTPAVAFDRSGRRVGYGGGFYDRFLPKTRPDSTRVGIGFDVQLVDDDLPNGHFDLRVDAVVTDAEVVRIERQPMRVAGPSRFARRRSWRDVEFVSLDFEATGLDFARDVIVSFGVVPVRGGRVVLADALHQLVDPDIPPSVVLAEGARAPAAGPGGRPPAGSGTARAPGGDPRSLPPGVVRGR